MAHSIADQPGGDANQVLILHNPLAGARSRDASVQSLAHAVTAKGLDAQCVGDLGEFERRARSAFESGRLRAIVAAGGDGTAAEAVNRSPPGAPVIVFPMGTENVLARYLGYRRDPAAIADLIEHGERAPLDACRANGRLFLLMIGVGFDAEVVRRLAEARRGHISRFTYAKPLLAAMRRYNYPELRVTHESIAVDGRDGADGKTASARWVFGMNVPKYALGLRFAAKATPMDGRLDVCLFQQGSILHGFRYLAYIVARRHGGLPDVRLETCRKLRIESVDDVTVPYQLDGDPGGVLPVEVTVEPKRFTAIVSTEQRDQLGPRMDDAHDVQ